MLSCFFETTQTGRIGAEVSRGDELCDALDVIQAKDPSSVVKPK